MFGAEQSLKSIVSMQMCVGVTEVNGRFLKVCVLKNCRLNILAVGSSEFTGCLQMEVPETT